MPTAQPNIRVIVRLPWNRPEDPLPDPPRVEWNAEKESILWEVIAKSRSVEGAGTDWKGLANHLQVPLPYLLYRAQVRYEEDLRGLQGIRGALSPTSPTTVATASSTPSGNPSGPFGEYFPVTAEKAAFPRRDTLRFDSGVLSASGSGRPLTIRTRLNSLGHRSLNSPQKVSSSSVLTLQGPKRPHTQLRLLSPTSSRASPSSPTSSADESEEDEDTRREAEEKRAEEQQAIDRKLLDLQRRMTKEALGLVSSPPKPAPYRGQDKGKGKETERGRIRPLSMSSTSSGLHQRLEMSRGISHSQTPSHHSLSSTSSPQGSIPSIPSPPPEPRSPQLSPMTRHFSPVGKSTSPPAISHGSAWGTMRHGRAKASAVRSERGSEIGSEASSFSDISDASLSASLESALMSNMSNMSNHRTGSRLSSFARNNHTPRRGGTR